MSKFSALVLTTFLTTAYITQGVASGVFEEKEVKKSFNLGSTDPNPFEFQNFNAPEGSHRWSGATECILTLPVVDGDARLKHVQFNFFALANDDHPQRLTVFLLDTQVIPERVFKNMISSVVDIDIPPALTDKLVFRFVIPDACLPREIDPNILDGRTLGFAFSNVTMTYSEKVSKTDVMSAAAEIARDEAEKALVSAAHKTGREVVNFAESAVDKIRNEAPRTVASIERRAPDLGHNATRETEKAVHSAGKKLKKAFRKEKKDKK